MKEQSTAGRIISALARRALAATPASKRMRNAVPVLPRRGDMITLDYVRKLMEQEGAWASCPLTENGVVRITCNPGYSQKIRLVTSELIRRLDSFAAKSDHEFWADDLSLRDKAHFVADRIHGSRQVTDIYLLGLAASHEPSVFVTFCTHLRKPFSARCD